MGDPVASEKAAELAAKESIDLGSVKGTGADGLIKVEDVRNAVADRAEKEEAQAAKRKAKAEREAAAAEKAKATEAAETGAEEEPAPPASDDEDAGQKAAKRTAARMPERAHAEGCPMDPTRVEVYDQAVPAKRQTDGSIDVPARTATMAHCVDCGSTKEIS